jgi:hypothetical protein
MWYFAHKEEVDNQYPKGAWIACTEHQGVIWTGSSLMDGMAWRGTKFDCYFTNIGYGQAPEKDGNKWNFQRALELEIHVNPVAADL